VREFRSHGSVRGALSNGRPYREHAGKSVDSITIFGKINPRPYIP
jgi:hypothetical protein